ncbi:MAG: hypothetical protein IIW67_01400 [Peptococcaceae bacterium]|nr:hypothetical protein [Peptococcaceae bacterium]MBQ5368989.1 hypothetical protein [Peptococcaceae bacterium]MBQ5615709.1 hypothetical protein [Peptococcaceae bacterium]MBQ5862345.1 hypothetical protein [Peptococcaceae bacterium]
MFITQLEYREKTTATNWRRMQFDRQMNFVSEDQALPVQLLDIIVSLAQFGAGNATHQFANGIARVTFHAAHQQFMWFCKSTLQDGALLIDEEELYDDGDTLLMRRAFEEFTLADTEAGQIAVSTSMLAQHPELAVLQKLQHGFACVLYLKPDDSAVENALEQIRSAAHGTLILLDGSLLSAPPDMAAFAQRSDIQLLTVNCTGIAEYTLERKGKNIALVQS